MTGRRVVTHAEAGDAERPGAGPGERVIAGDLERLAPPGEAVVRAELCEPAGVVRALSSVDLAGRPRDRVPDRCDEPAEAEKRHRDARDAERPNDRIAPFGDEPFDRNAMRERDHDERSRRRGEPRTAARRARGRRGQRRHRRARSGRTPRRRPRGRAAPRAAGAPLPFEPVAPESQAPSRPSTMPADQPGARLRQHQGDDRDVDEHGAGTRRRAESARGHRRPAPPPRRRGATARSSNRPARAAGRSGRRPRRATESPPRATPSRLRRR